jgi:hypothetical protein
MEKLQARAAGEEQFSAPDSEIRFHTTTLMSQHNRKSRAIIHTEVSNSVHASSRQH